VSQAWTLSLKDAEIEAARLRGDGWAVTIGTPPETRVAQRARKARAQVIADHQTSRQARRKADDAAGAEQARQQALRESGEDWNSSRPD